MIEDAAGNAFQKITDTGVLGSVLILTIIAAIIGFRYLTKTIGELKDELKAERLNHDKTRQAQIEDIRNMASLGKSIEGLRDAVIRRVPAE